MIRLGLCCIFRGEPIRFRTTTAARLALVDRTEAAERLSSLCLANADALLSALGFCAANGVGCFRVTSQLLPLKTHPQFGYGLLDLPGGDTIVASLKACGEFAALHNLRTAFHPDQFVVLNSPRKEVVAASAAEIEYQAEVAEWIGADVINVHGGGGYGDRREALSRFADGLALLSVRARSRLTVENDERIFSPDDLLPVCRSASIPLVYDVHHHRCRPDALSIEDATAAALSTWNREPLFHISSPIEGWSGPGPQRHHDYIDIADFPACWRGLPITVEVEAKAKELAVLRLRHDLQSQGVA